MIDSTRRPLSFPFSIPPSVPNALYIILKTGHSQIIAFQSRFSFRERPASIHSLVCQSSEIGVGLVSRPFPNGDAESQRDDKELCFP